MDGQRVGEQWELRDPAALLRKVRRRHEWRVNELLLAIVHDPTRTQRLAGLTRVGDLDQGGNDEAGYYERTAHLTAAVERAGLEMGAPMSGRFTWPVMVFVAVTEGRCIVRNDLVLWMNDLLYVNLIPAYMGDALVVTEHGWRSVNLQIGGATPRRVAPRPAPLLGIRATAHLA